MSVTVRKQVKSLKKEIKENSKPASTQRHGDDKEM